MKKNDLMGKQITVVGGGISGVALACLAKDLGGRVFLSEMKDSLRVDITEKLKYQGLEWETGGHSSRAWDADLILLSSGISPDSEAVNNAISRNIQIQGELDFVYPYLNGRLIGITGSNGKTTTTSLTSYLLKKAGFKVAEAGNIGMPLSNIVKEDWEYTVMELSSFQLYWSSCFSVDSAIITNLAPDHIDWHGSYKNYIESKSRLINNVKENGWVIVQKRDFPNINFTGKGKLALMSWEDPSDNSEYHPDAEIFIDKKNIWLREMDGIKELIEDTISIPLIGDHNRENIAMALSCLSLLRVSIKDLMSQADIFKGFVPPPHRCQLVRVLNGVSYIDDSKGTNVAATIAALSSIEGDKIIILGGKGKGEDYSPLARQVGDSAVAAVIMGEERQLIAKALSKEGFSDYYITDTMEKAVNIASSLAKEGTNILLSPACTSWDMYENYKKRGEHFQSIVNNLSKEKNDPEK